MLWQIFSCPLIHSVPGRRYFHGITLRDNPPFYSLADLMPERITGLRAKRKQRQPNALMVLPLYTFFRPVMTTPLVRCFYSVEPVFHQCFLRADQHWLLIGRVCRNLFFYPFPFQFLPIQVMDRSGTELNGSQWRRYISCSSRRCKFMPFGFCKNNLHPFG